MYMNDFLSESEERSLYHVIQSLQLHTFTFQGHEAKRKVASFGYHYSFEHKALTVGESIPPGFHPLIAKVASAVSIHQDFFAELLVTEYPIGSVINWHRDAMPFGVIAGVSLLSDCIFKLRPFDEQKRTRKATIKLELKRRSLYLMSGPSRYDWQHAIAPVKSIRYSITLRTLKHR
jgi:alkylated DNA repair dioxygenase AlkB